MDAWLPSVDGCPKPGQIAVWILSLIFTLLFFILGCVSLAKRNDWFGEAQAGIVPHHFHHHGINPLGMHEGCWYVVYIFITLASLAGFILILIMKKVDSENPIKPLFAKFGKFHLVPLICGFALLCFCTIDGGLEGKTIVALIFSIASLVMIILIWVFDKPKTPDWKTWFCTKLFLGSLAFFHFNNFLECFNNFHYWHCGSNVYDFHNWGNRLPNKDCTNWEDRAIAFQVVLCVLAMAGIAVWTFLIEDIVVAFYGLMLFIGVIALGVEGFGGDEKHYKITTLICGLVGIVVVIVVVVIGFVMKKKMLWDSLS